MFKRLGEFYVYIVQCQDKTYYTGYTNDLEKRIKEHNNSKRGAKYLRGRKPVKLVYAKEYKCYKNALRAEWDIKKRARKEKEAMIQAHKESTKNIIPPDLLRKSMRGDDIQRCES